MLVPRNFHLLVAATLVCGLLMISYVSRTVNQSRMAMLSVSGVEKVQHLDNQISNRLANEELAKWDKLEAKIFPSDSDKRSSVSKKAVATHQAHKSPVVSQLVPKKAAVFFSSGSGQYSTDLRFHHVAPVVPQPKQAKTQKKAMEVSNSLCFFLLLLFFHSVPKSQFFLSAAVGRPKIFPWR
jgi:hypothetical protein